jgi:hypothetical protein
MNIEKDFILNNDGEDRWVMNVEGKPEIFGVIEKEYTKSKSMFVFSIKYYWNKVLQDTKYADDLESAENKLKDILTKVDTKVKEKEMEVQYEMKNVKSFESFVNEAKKKPNEYSAFDISKLKGVDKREYLLNTLYVYYDDERVEKYTKTSESPYWVKVKESFLAGDLPELSKDFDTERTTSSWFDKTYYDNPENLSPDEIHAKLRSLGYGENRNKRFWKLSSYSTDKITKDEYIKKYTSK